MSKQEPGALGKQDTPKSIARELKTQVFVLGGFITIIWALEFIDLLFLGRSLDLYGIRPRSFIAFYFPLFYTAVLLM